MLTFLIPLALVAVLALLLILLRTSQTKDQVEVTVIKPWEVDPMEIPWHYFWPDRRAEFKRGLWLDADPPTWAWPMRPRPRQLYGFPVVYDPTMPTDEVRFVSPGRYGLLETRGTITNIGR